MNNRSVKTAAIFSIWVFVTFSVTMLATASLTMLLACTGILDRFHREVPLIIFALVSVALGTAMSQIVGRRPIAKIIQISEATKQIAKGDFSVRLDENIPIAEFREMAHHFNLMAKELAGTEMLRNDFIENVSHEFKTPLTAIDGYVTLLQRKELSEEKRIEYTEKILLNTKRLSSLTGNILLLSRLEHQELEIQTESFSLDEQIREAILLFEPQWSAKQLELEIELDAADFCGNRELLAQVWQNILGNAMKFVPDRGRVHISLYREKSNLVVSVSDDGIGMSREAVQRVFEKFYQADSSRSAAGNGLGMALAKRIIDLHHGTIEAASLEGHGTTFTVRLPDE